MPPLAWNAIIAIAVAALPVPALMALDSANSGCGDGLCGFIPGLLILGTLAAATLTFIARSSRRGETPAILRLVPFALWALAVTPLIF
jgi:hypothetical protein